MLTAVLFSGYSIADKDMSTTSVSASGFSTSAICEAASTTHQTQIMHKFKGSLGKRGEIVFASSCTKTQEK